MNVQLLSSFQVHLQLKSNFRSPKMKAEMVRKIVKAEFYSNTFQQNKKIIPLIQFSQFGLILSKLSLS